MSNFMEELKTFSASSCFKSTRSRFVAICYGIVDTYMYVCERKCVGQTTEEMRWTASSRSVVKLVGFTYVYMRGVCVCVWWANRPRE